jgi:hypothetical protein
VDDLRLATPSGWLALCRVTALSGAFAAMLVQGMSLQTRRFRLSELRRLESIALMNHHIRNALQAIVCCSGSSESAEIIHDSVNRIGLVLADVLPQHGG